MAALILVERCVGQKETEIQALPPADGAGNNLDGVSLQPASIIPDARQRCVEENNAFILDYQE